MSHFSWKQRVLIVPPIVLGGILLFLAPGMKAEPPTSTQSTGKKVVRILKIEPRQLQPVAVGYGHTEPAQEWEAQSELDGTIIWNSEKFQEGNIISKGTPLLKIDPSSYELEIAKLDAEIKVAKLKDETISASLKIASEEYKIQRSEYERSLQLSKTGHISKTEKDRATRELLSSQQQLQTLKNNLVINQAEQQVLQTQLSLAQRDLKQTTISAPFDLRITEKLVGFAEYVNKGEILLRADGIAAVEVSAQFPLGKMRPLHQAINKNNISGDLHNELDVLIELNAGERIISWNAKVNRSGGHIDAQTQSQSIVVRIDDPYGQAQPGKKPPLIRDTFVKVTLMAPVLKKQILIPANAIHQNKVYVVNDEGKLQIKPVKVAFIQDQIAVIKEGIEVNDKVIVSQLSPAVKGMPLKPQPDKKMIEWLNKTTGFDVKKTPKTEGKS
ncbi:efflux RND transporter periplasmic adaptor subunit [Vibrio algarum]|uniref:Efflux RND transporter periplasmic adaptor subunit n=1 Tax=Vibrio algarum TaxID=3020714 RepID=A0ABT4YW65_9VIBR|nr:efflux RND transporter periplasmic adaptor subunit [Vibrio sp. KJ40-1]MDB1125824.1 efflux RND transporter periplasmic adaptor subunit [Vibrio sp. KJ40-1]